MRKHLMGKRVDYSARTVITPDAKLPFGTLGIPRQVANTLTFPEIVNKINIKYLTDLVNNGKAASLEKTNGRISYLKHKVKWKYEIGDILFIKNKKAITTGMITEL